MTANQNQIDGYGSPVTFAMRPGPLIRPILTPLPSRLSGIAVI